MPSQHRKIKTLKTSSKPKFYPLKKKKTNKKKIDVLVGSIELVGSHMILQSYTILHDPTIFTILVWF